MQEKAISTNPPDFQTETSPNPHPHPYPQPGPPPGVEPSPIPPRHRPVTVEDVSEYSSDSMSPSEQRRPLTTNARSDATRGPRPPPRRQGPRPPYLPEKLVMPTLLSDEKPPIQYSKTERIVCFDPAKPQMVPKPIPAQGVPIASAPRPRNLLRKKQPKDASSVSSGGRSGQGVLRKAQPIRRAPNGTLQNANPQNAIPQNANPQNTNPQNAYPQNAYPQNAYPQNAYPQNAYPQNAYLQNAYPQNANPQNQNAYPQNEYPQNANPHNTYPQNGYPQNAYPQNEYPQNAPNGNRPNGNPPTGNLPTENPPTAPTRDPAPPRATRRLSKRRSMI
jgi:hypothetical protein